MLAVFIGIAIGVSSAILFVLVWINSVNMLHLNMGYESTAHLLLSAIVVVLYWLAIYGVYSLF